MNKNLKLALSGSSGKMGRAITELLKPSDSNIEIAYHLNSKSTTLEIQEACSNSDVILDFSTAQASMHIVDLLENLQDKKILIGTTGFSNHEQEKISKLQTNHAILYAPNTSITANLVANLSAKASSLLRDFDAEIIDSHHKDKRDAPSGTAIMIGKKIATSRNIDFDKYAVYSWHEKNKRQKDQIGFSSIRGGGIYGDNEVILAGNSEMLSISCRALDRRAFAFGAIKAAIWLSTKNSGYYTMSDFLSID